MNKNGAISFLVGVILVIMLITVLMYIFFNNGTFNQIFKSVSEHLAKPDIDPSSSSSSYYNSQDEANKFNDRLAEAFSEATKSDKSICLVPFESLGKSYYNNWYVLDVTKTDDGVAITTLRKTKKDHDSPPIQLSDTINVKGVNVCVVEKDSEAQSFVEHFINGKPIDSGLIGKSIKQEVSIDYDFNEQNLKLHSIYEDKNKATFTEALFNTDVSGPKTFLVKDGKNVCFIKIYKGDYCTKDVKDGAISSGCLSSSTSFSLLTQIKKYPNYLCTTTSQGGKS